MIGGKWGNREDLGGHRHLGAFVAECLSENPFAFAQSVHLGGIEERDPQGTGTLDDVTGGAGGVGVAVAPFA